MATLLLATVVETGLYFQLKPLPGPGQAQSCAVSEPTSAGIQISFFRAALTKSLWGSYAFLTPILLPSEHDPARNGATRNTVRRGENRNARCSLYRGNAGVFRHRDRLCLGLRKARIGTATMAFDILLIAIAVLLFGYLLIALLWPERF